MSENAQAVGLAEEVWKFLGSRRRWDPKTRPPMEEVARKWQKFVENDDDSDGVLNECVRIALSILVSSSVPFSAY